jgi:hypothetical protein
MHKFTRTLSLCVQAKQSADAWRSAVARVLGEETTRLTVLDERTNSHAPCPYVCRLSSQQMPGAVQ